MASFIQADKAMPHRFPFGLIYQIRTNEILIVSVMDLRRDPTPWKDLL